MGWEPLGRKHASGCGCCPCPAQLKPGGRSAGCCPVTPMPGRPVVCRARPPFSVDEEIQEAGLPPNSRLSPRRWCLEDSQLVFLAGRSEFSKSSGYMSSGRERIRRRPWLHHHNTGVLRHRPADPQWFTLSLGCSVTTLQWLLSGRN